MTSEEPQGDGRRFRYIFHRLPRCPACDSTRLLCYATRRQSDSSVTRYCRCAVCGARVLMVCE
jgi:DNA-directed RNA polymerase subunit M/transcription elongation factor TFIIS